MSIPINSFPVLTPHLFQKIGYVPGEYYFYYQSGCETFQLNTEPISFRDDVVKVIDERCEWTADTHNIELTRDFQISIPVHLFGTNGIVCTSSKIGVAVLWTSKTSNQRGVIKVGAFSRDDSLSAFHVRHSFNAGSLIGSVNFSTILYIDTAGKPDADENHFANMAGTVLGMLDSFSIIIDGNGSVFPVVEVSVPSQPLWWVQCNWTDPIVDAFDEDNVKICINNAHRDYGMLNIKAGLKESPMLRDVIASAIAIIIQKVKDTEFWNDTLRGNGLTDGSISQAVNYFITTFEWDYQSPEKLAISIRQDFDRRFR